MAKKEMGSVSAGLFSTQSEATVNPVNSVVQPSVQLHKEKNKSKSISVGRPKASDLDSHTGELIRKTVYITPEQNKKLAYYSFDNNMDFSETIRMLIDTHL